jgi:hypothetical protein
MKFNITFPDLMKDPELNDTQVNVTCCLCFVLLC